MTDPVSASEQMTIEENGGGVEYESDEDGLQHIYFFIPSASTSPSPTLLDTNTVTVSTPAIVVSGDENDYDEEEEYDDEDDFDDYDDDDSVTQEIQTGEMTSDDSNSFRMMIRRIKITNLTVVEIYMQDKTSFLIDVLKVDFTEDHRRRREEKRKMTSIDQERLVYYVRESS
ncbi:hypothetical protein FQN54_004593 [Arachnomyces sp. PD_36]|nr:hypothetical protein FQN54_004593 [Arachnomyces sp. PD_36]